MTSRMQSLYTGRSGHLAVMAEFLHLGYNVAMPEVDRGDDIFVVHDRTGEFNRIQVKAAIGREGRRSSALYRVPLKQLRKPVQPELWYVFTIRCAGRWNEFLVIRRDELDDYRSQGMGISAQGNLLLRLSFGPGDVRCGSFDLQHFRNNWAKWPKVTH